MKKCNMQEKHKEAMARLLKAQFMKGNKINFLIAVVVSFLMAAGNLVVSWLLQQIIDAATGNEGSFSLEQLVVISILLVVALIIVFQIDRIFRPRFVAKAVRQYKECAFLEISRKNISSFARENTATYISALSNDATSIENNWLNKVFVLIQQIVCFIGAFAMMVYYSPILTLSAIVLSVFPILGSVFAGNKLAQKEQEVSDKNESFVATVKDMLTGFSVIKSFKAEVQMIGLFSNKNAEVEDTKCSRRRMEILIQMIGLAAGITAQFGVFLIGAFLALQNKGLTAGVVIIFVQLMNFVISPIEQVPQILANKKASDALVDKLAVAISENPQSKGKDIDNKLDRAIELKNVSFGYEEGTQILKDISLSFEAGKSYAIVGGSGSGKSTLLNLLLGSYMNYEGEIRYDGEELRTVNLDCIYDMVSLVQQNVFVFDSTIKNNITMFRSFDKEKLQKAIEMSGLSELIERCGADYQCGENGSGLSGGERQRISIARSLLRGAPVMLIDEATAALDAETAFSITNSILEISGLTRIVITHRLEETLMKKYDKIFVLKNGMINEAGKFDELMEQKGYFYSLYTVSQ